MTSSTSPYRSTWFLAQSGPDKLELSHVTIDSRTGVPRIISATPKVRRIQLSQSEFTIRTKAEVFRNRGPDPFRRGHVLAGAAVSLSKGKGSFANPGSDVGANWNIESTMTTVSPYARFDLTERVSAWGLAGFAFSDGAIYDDEPANDDNAVRLDSNSVSGVPSWKLGDKVPVSQASSLAPDKRLAGSRPTSDPVSVEIAHRFHQIGC